MVDLGHPEAKSRVAARPPARFGSLSLAWCCERTAVTSIRWLGVHPTEFSELEEEQLRELSQVDRTKLRYYTKLLEADCIIQY